MHSIEVAVKQAQDAVKAMGEEFTDPDDDWLGMLVLETEEENGQRTTGYAPLPFANQEEKEIVATMFIPALIRHTKPLMVATVLSAWMVEHDTNKGPLEIPEDDTGRPSVKLHPDRIEVVIISVFTLDDFQMWSAPILRSKTKPPRLGRWKMAPAADRMEGMFYDPIQEALREVWG